MPDIVKLLTEKLQHGFVHPGDRGKGIPPTPIALPFKPTPGMPKEMGDLMIGTAKLLAECIVSTIEVDGESEIVPRTEAKAMRRAVGEGPSGPAMVPVHCRCDRKFANPLIVLTVTDPDRIVIDGRTLLRGMAGRSPQCPHGPLEYPEVVELQQTLIGVMDGLLKKDLSNAGREAIGAALHEFINGAEG